MRICVIGAGVAGIVAAKYVSTSGYECDILESSSQIGGTWVYSDRIGIDQFGFPFYSAMYEGLRTNLPKEVMSFPDYCAKNEKSYLSREEVLDFLNNYVDNFSIRSKIKFNHLVIQVRPTNDDKWEIKSIDKPSKQESVDIYDVVMICTGIYLKPNHPAIPGIQKFKGELMHSNAFRSPQSFKNKRILVIGAGPSAIDITMYALTVAQNVAISHHSSNLSNFKNISNLKYKPDVSCIVADKEVEFIDGTVSSFDIIVYCTGYKYDFPFLSSSCKVTVEDFLVKNLYKQIICIDKPNLCFIGVPSDVCAFRMFDLQTRFYMKYLNGEMKIPSKKEMISDTQEFYKRRFSENGSIRKTHVLGDYQETYFKELSNDANIQNIPPVILKMWNDSVKGIFNDIYYFREYNYKIINSNTFIKTK